MVIIQDFKVQDSKWLVINLTSNPTVSNAYIKSIKISCDGSYTDSATSVFDTLISEQIDFSTNPTSANLKLDVDFTKGPFYMLVVVGIVGEAPTTCAFKTNLEVVTFDKYPLFKTLNCLANELEGCDTPQTFIDFLFRWQALKASMEVMDKDKINYYFKWFVLNTCPTGSNVTIKKPCGCRV